MKINFFCKHLFHLGHAFSSWKQIRNALVALLILINYTPYPVCSFPIIYMESQGDSYFWPMLRGWGPPQGIWLSNFSQQASEAAQGAFWKTKGVGLRTALCKGPVSRGQNKDAGFGCGKGPRELCPLLSDLLSPLSFKVILIGPLKSHLPFTDSNIQINRNLEKAV